MWSIAGIHLQEMQTISISIKNIISVNDVELKIIAEITLICFIAVSLYRKVLQVILVHLALAILVFQVAVFQAAAAIQATQVSQAIHIHTDIQIMDLMVS